MKNFFDFGIAIMVLVILSPLFIICALIIKIYDGGPVFYSAQRVGKNGHLFRMLKFRTMVVNADKLGASSTTNHDVRITAPGKFMRKFKLDELPQFINVMKGEMSIVGPRPQVEWAVKLYSDEEKKILQLKPGITDFASIRFRNEGKILLGSADPDKLYMELIHPEKMKLSLQYLKERSFLTDLKIIFLTFSSIFKNHNDDSEKIK